MKSIKRFIELFPTRPSGIASGRITARRLSAFPGGLLTPAEIFIGSFLLLVVLGTLGFKFLPNLYQGAPLTWNQAAFTATSAVCVTGLIVVDTSTHFTFQGQLFILVLIQLGGLGMLVLTSLIITMLGGRPSLRTEIMAAANRDAIPHVSARKLIRDVVLFTITIEAIGAILLYVLWLPRLGYRGAIWPAVFHSVSAFCNAGFSTNSDSLTSFHDSPATLLVVSLLVIFGGIGFVTIEELSMRYGKKSRRIHRLSVHSQLVLTATAVLLFGAWLLFACLEWKNTLADMSWLNRIVNAFFMSVTSRTAGFNTVDYAHMTESANFLAMLLMMVGGCPGSTAGGMKATTFALLVLLAWCKLRSQATVVFHNRSIPEETIHRATGLFVIATGIVVGGVFLLTLKPATAYSGEAFLEQAFEVVSAFNTVGLSMGATSELTSVGQWIIIVLMFVGRIGPLSIATALTVRLYRRGRFRLAYEEVMVG